MKKLLLSMTPTLCSIYNYADNKSTSPYYYVGLDGNVYVKMVFGSVPTDVWNIMIANGTSYANIISMSGFPPGSNYYSV